MRIPDYEPVNTNDFIDHEKALMESIGNNGMNVMSKAQYEQIIQSTFTKIADILSKSYGPYGSNTFISQYPYISTTKDGYTIMKMLTPRNYFSRIISKMFLDICGRLNNTVGDGTTTAVVAANALYNAYIENRTYFDENRIAPRYVLKAFKDLQANIEERLKRDYVVPVESDSPEFLNIIHDIVYVSTNGDDTITDMIVELYSKLKYPSIDIKKAADGVTKSEVIDGFVSTVKLTDDIYHNNDDRTYRQKDCDVIVFDHKVTLETYDKIIKPLKFACMNRQRKLIVVAPFYDAKAIQGQMRSDILREYTASHELNLILCTCDNTTSYAKENLSDLCMLLNTVMITSETEDSIIRTINTGEAITDVFNIDGREIPGIAVYNTDSNAVIIATGSPDEYAAPSAEMRDDWYKIGFASSVDIGDKTGLFSGFYYDKSLYEKHVFEADSNLNDAVLKYKALGTFNLEINDCRRRVSALKLRMGLISVGADSELSQSMLYDAVDDAVRAACSAFNNGIVLGGQISTLCATSDIMAEFTQEEKDSQSLNYMVCRMMKRSLMMVYRTVIMNRDSGIPYNISIDDYDIIIEEMNKLYLKNKGSDIWINVKENISSIREVCPPDYKIDMCDIIIQHCICEKIVYDVVNYGFSSNIVNSVETDIEILKATIDLISLIISGNQMIYMDIMPNE